MKISVIIPIYNSKKYIKKCLESVLSQTIIEEVEIICIDDGSTDDSVEILHNYTKKYNNVRTFSQKNAGPGIARNYGIINAAGDYIAFMDSDDYYPSDNVLEVLYNAATSKNVLICGGSMKFYDVEGELELTNGYYKGCSFNSDQMMDYMDYQWIVGFGRFIYSKNLLVNNNIFFPNYKLFEDPPFMAKALSKANKFYAIEKDVYRYRKFHKESGYKYTRKMVCDFLQGILEILRISNEYSYEKLHESIMEWVDGMLSVYICKYLAMGDQEVEKLLLQINSTYDESVCKTGENPLSKHINIAFLKECYANSIIEKKKFDKTIQEYDNIILFGAGRVGQEVCRYLKMEQNIIPICYAISSQTKGRFVDAIPVKSIVDLTEYQKAALVIITIANKHQDDVKEMLSKLKFEHTYELDDMMFAQITPDADS